jgi:predicted Zn-dependent peptidase
VREKRGLAYSVYSYRAMFADTGAIAIYAGTTPQNARTVIDIIVSELQSVVADGITEAELARAKGHLKGSLVLASEDPGARMNSIGKQQLTTGEILSVDESIRRFDAVQMDDVRRVARELLGRGSLQITVVGPFEEGTFDRYAA